VPGLARGPAPGVVTLRPRLDRAEAFIVVTPEYNHSFPGALKLLIDAGNAEWHAKPLAFVSYGGVSGGLRAVEQLRLVFAELHCVAIRDTVSFAHARQRFDAAGRLREPAAAEAALGTMLAHLLWWRRALKAARQAVPYEDLAA